MLGSQIIDNGYHDTKNMVGNINDLLSPHSLVGSVKRYLKIDIGGNKDEIRKTFIGMDPSKSVTEEQIEYAAGDVEYLYPLYKEQQKYIKERELENIIKLENTLTPVIVKMEFKGCLINQSKHKENIKAWKKKLKDIEFTLDQEVIRLATAYPEIQGGKFTNPRKTTELTQLDLFGGDGYVVKNLNLYNINYSSPKQIQDIFSRIGAPMPIDDIGKISFGENPINTYVTNHPESPLKPFVAHLLDYREYSKLLGTYGEKFLNVLDKDGRLRSSYGQCWTDTLRLNSAELVKNELGTNLANIPKRVDIRSIFIPDPGYSFVDCDQSGQEVLIAGSFSGEPVLIKAFKEGFDHHSYLGSISYSIIFDEKFELKNVKEDFEMHGYKYSHIELRQEHKSCLFAMFYGGGAKRVQNVLNKYLVNHWPPERRLEKADEIARALKAALPLLIKYLRAQAEVCKRQGYVVANKLGARRYFDDVDKAYGEILNYGIQGTGAQSIKIAMINIDKWFSRKSKELNIPEEQLGWLAMSVYDQNLCCLNNKYLEYAPEIQKIMGESLTYFLDHGLVGSSDMKIKDKWSK